jgi:serine O-acetyltransferase
MGYLDLNDYFKYDYFKMTGEKWSTLRGVGRFVKHYKLRFIYFGRKLAESKFILAKFYYQCIVRSMEKKYGLEIDFKNIGKGLLLTHAFNITINPRAKLGEDITIFKGATIGSIRSGKRAGVPIIGDRLTICCNSFIAGNIRIGNDVLIAANTFVDFDVPDNSLVFGNPGIIKHKENASNDYLHG